MHDGLRGIVFALVVPECRSFQTAIRRFLLFFARKLLIRRVIALIPNP